MTLEGRQKLRNLILNHESYKQFPYNDTTGCLTIGIGRNLSDRGISQNEAFSLLDDDIIYFYSKLSQLCSYFNDLDENRKIALIDMCFNLGVHGFLGFNDLHTALEIHDYENASKAMLDSKWAQQVGERAITDANIIKTGCI